MTIAPVLFDELCTDHFLIAFTLIFLSIVQFSNTYHIISLFKQSEDVIDGQKQVPLEWFCK